MTPRRIGSVVVVGVLVASIVGLVAQGADASARPSASAATTWTSGWTSAMQEANPLTNATNLSCRNISRVSAAGTAVRVHISNAQVTTAVTFNAASVGIRSSGPAIQSGSLRTLTFGGSASVTVPAGGEVVSDPVSLTVASGTDLAVTTYNSGTVPMFPNHRFGLVSHYCTTFNGTGGNQTGSLSGSTLTGVTNNVPWIDGIDVQTASTGTIIAFGDSITDGVGTGVDSFSTYPNQLVTLLRSQSPAIPAAVVNEGIGGNDLVSGGTGPTGLSRFAHDVTAQAGARVVVVLEGTNDIANGATAQSVENGLATAAQSAHTAGLRIIVGTILPRHGGIGWAGANAGTLDATRDQVNAFIRSSTAFDAVVDFDAALKNTNPNYPAANTPDYREYLAAGYDSGDKTHPNAQGYGVMAGLFNLPQLRQWTS